MAGLEKLSGFVSETHHPVLLGDPRLDAVRPEDHGNKLSLDLLRRGCPTLVARSARDKVMKVRVSLLMLLRTWLLITCLTSPHGVVCSEHLLVLGHRRPELRLMMAV